MLDVPQRFLLIMAGDSFIVFKHDDRGFSHGNYCLNIKYEDLLEKERTDNLVGSIFRFPITPRVLKESEVLDSLGFGDRAVFLLLQVTLEEDGTYKVINLPTRSFLGTKIPGISHFVNGVLHGAPAVTKDQFSIYFKHGKYHRTDGPAWNSGHIHTYYVDGEMQRNPEEGPTHYYADTTTTHLVIWENGGRRLLTLRNLELGFPQIDSLSLAEAETIVPAKPETGVPLGYDPMPDPESKCAAAA